METQNNLMQTFKQRKFLLKQLISRDFKGRYKRTVLGVMWSMLSPLIFFMVQALIFTYIFKKTEHYITYLIVGNIVFHYFTDATTQAMFSITANAGIISKIKLPKEIFLYSKSVSCFINFLLTLIIMFIVVAIDKTAFHPIFFALIIPMILLFFMNIGIGYILSAFHVFFKDTQYLYSIVTRILVYISAIFYRIELLPQKIQKLFYLNPVYCYIDYFRTIIMEKQFPAWYVQVSCIIYPVVFITIGKIIYKIYDKKFAFYF